MYSILILKSLHIFGFVAWMSALFYLGRIFVYHQETEALPEDQRGTWKKHYSLMEKRAYQIIGMPAMIITYIGGVGMMVVNPAYLSFPWMYVKLTLVFLLTGYHYYCKGIMKKLGKGTSQWSSFQFRLLNEVPTVILVPSIVLGVFRDQTNYLYLILGMLIFIGLLYLGARKYKEHRENVQS